MQVESRTALIAGAVCTCVLVIATAVLTLSLYRGGTSSVLASASATTTPSRTPTQPEPTTAPAVATEPASELTSIPTPVSQTEELTTLPADDPAPTQTREAVPTRLPALAEQVIAAQQDLHSGELEAVIMPVTGNRTIVHTRFELGDAHSSLRAQISATIESATGTQTIDVLVSGDVAWERQPDGSWRSITPRDDVWAITQRLLPDLTRAVDIRMSGGTDLAGLLWYDPERDADLTLVVDPANGLPLGMRSVPRTSGSTLTITYRSWNTPIVIDLP